jgi:hypothetical protein
MQAYSLDLRQRIAQVWAVPGARRVHVSDHFWVSVAFHGQTGAPPAAH